MSEMVERVAKAMRVKAAEIDNRPNVHEADPMWFAEEYARAAIEAMREPTDDMKIAAVQAAVANNKPAAARHAERNFADGILSEITAGDSRNLVAGWCAMIDEALR